MTLEITPALVERVRAIARRAGVAVMEVYASDFQVDGKVDNSPVTEADRRAEAVIIAGLEEDLGDLVPSFPIVAEEAVAAGHVPVVGDDPFWLVDPLDGTKQFVNRRGEFTVNIALVDGRVPVLGVVHAPVIGTMYWGSPLGAFRESAEGDVEPISARAAPIGGLVAVVSRSHRTWETDAFLKEFTIAEEITSGSSIKLCMVAAGRADLYPRMGRTMEWDIAAGHAVVRFAGGMVRTLDGAELSYGKPGFENPYFVVRGMADA